MRLGNVGTKSDNNDKEREFLFNGTVLSGMRMMPDR